MDVRTWGAAQTRYHELRVGKGVEADLRKGAVSRKLLQKTIRTKGSLPLATVLRCPIRHFTDGAVLGSKAFVEEHIAASGKTRGAKRSRTAARPMPELTDWGGMTTLRGLRKDVFG